MDSSFLLPPSAFCVRGPFTRVLIPFMPLICVLCSAKGVGRARGEARWLTSSLRKHRDLAGHLPNSGRGEIPVSGRDSSNATVPERTPPSSSRICTFLLCCQSRDFSARHSIFVDVRKGVEKEGWEKATHFIYGLCSDPSFHYFNPTEIRNHNPWMKRH